MRSLQFIQKFQIPTDLKVKTCTRCGTPSYTKDMRKYNGKWYCLEGGCYEAKTDPKRIIGEAVK